MGETMNEVPTAELRYVCGWRGNLWHVGVLQQRWMMYDTNVRSEQGVYVINYEWRDVPTITEAPE
jgi:hypothetical protein